MNTNIFGAGEFGVAGHVLRNDPDARSTALGSRMISCPATIAVPLEGGTSVVNMRISVLLPAPFGPSRPKISPLWTVKLTLSTASSAPKRLLMASTSIATPFCDRLVLHAVSTGAARRQRRHRQHHPGRHAQRSLPWGLGTRTRMATVLMSRLVRLTLRCVAKSASTAL